MNNQGTHHVISYSDVTFLYYPTTYTENEDTEGKERYCNTEFFFQSFLTY